MESRDLKDLVRFSEGGVTRETVFETERVWSEVLCFDRAQRLGPLKDAAADAVFTIVAGEAVFQVDRKRKRLGQWGSVLVPAGAELTVANASVEPLVLLLVVAPPPTTPV